MKPNFTLWFSVLALFVSLSSCEDHRIPETQRFRIKKATFAVNSVVVDYINYNYGSNNKLISTQSYTIYPDRGPFLFREANWFYDEKSRLTKIESEIYTLSAPNPITDSYVRTAYSYDENDNITAIKNYNVLKANPNYPFLAKDRQLIYGSGKFPIKIMTKINIGSQFDPQQDFSEEYTYTGGNVVAIKYTYAPTRRNGYMSSTNTVMLQYDDKFNPYYGLNWGNTPDAGVFSKNNQLEGDRSYKYDSNGLLIEIAQRDGSSSRSYEYETY